MSRRVLWVVVILLVMVVFVWFRESIVDLFNGGDTQDIPEEIVEIGPVEELIEEARVLGDEERQYQSALEVLDEAKNYIDPFPTEEETVTIAELIERYTQALSPAKASAQETEPIVAQVPSRRPKVQRKISPRKRMQPKPIVEPLLEEEIEVEIEEEEIEARVEEEIEEEIEEVGIEKEIEELQKEETVETPAIFEDLVQTPEALIELETKEEEGLFEEELEMEEELENLADELYEKGREALDKKEYETAISFFNQALDYDPDHVLSYSYKASAHYERGEVDDALDSADEALQLEIDEPNAHFVRGEIFYDAFEDDEAEDEYRKAIEGDTENGLAYFKLGVLSLLADRNEDSEVLFGQALELEKNLESPYVLYSHYNRGIARERLEKLEDSIMDYQDALEFDANYEKAYIQLGQTLYKEQSYDQAIEVLSEGRSRFPESLPIAFLEAKSLDARYDSEEELSDLEGALEGYDAVLELDGEHVVSLYNRARLEYKKGNYRQALEDLDQASETERDYLIDLLYGNIYFALEDYEESRKHYESALEMGPSKIEAYQGIGAIDIAQARSSGDFPRLWNNAKENLEQALEQALEESLEESLEVKPRSNFELNQALGSVYYHLEDYDRSIASFQQALLEKEEDRDTHLNLGELYFAMENYSEAIPHYERGVELYFESFESEEEEEEKSKLYDLYLRLGESYLELSNQKEALVWLERLVREFPESIKERRVRIYLRAARQS